MTNLTDEGLRSGIKEIVHIKRLGCVDPIEDLIFSFVQQVRDAAKKEEREACAKVAEKWIYYDDPTSGTDPNRHEIATAIRQMGGGK